LKRNKRPKCYGIKIVLILFKKKKYLWTVLKTGIHYSKD
jgi:hypothetical protein